MDLKAPNGPIHHDRIHLLHDFHIADFKWHTDQRYFILFKQFDNLFRNHRKMSPSFNNHSGSNLHQSFIKRLFDTIRFHQNRITGSNYKFLSFRPTIGIRSIHDRNSLYFFLYPFRTSYNMKVFKKFMFQ